MYAQRAARHSRLGGGGGPAPSAAADHVGHPDNHVRRGGRFRGFGSRLDRLCSHELCRDEQVVGADAAPRSFPGQGEEGEGTAGLENIGRNESRPLVAVGVYRFGEIYQGEE